MADVIFENVTCRYAGTSGPAVSGLDLRIADGELLALCGGPGSGKSTVLRLLAGLVPVTSGRIVVGGYELADVTAPVTLLFQNYAIYPNLTVAENIGLPLSKQGLPKRAVADRVAEAAGHLELTRALPRGASELSAGERARVALARAIVRRPAALLLDEPLGNLQPAIRTEVAELMVVAQRKHGITTVYATDDPEEALGLGDRVALLEDGVLSEVVAPRDLGPSGGQRAAGRRSDAPG